MKKLLSILMSLLMFATVLLSGCGEPAETVPETTPAETAITEAPTETEDSEPTLAEYDYVQNKNIAEIKNPYTEWPDYSLKEGASIDEMRQMAVKVMRDELSIPWTPNEPFSYNKAVGLTKTYEFQAKVPYAGLPYTTGGTGLLQWLEYYDMRNGVVFSLPTEIDKYLGNSCASACAWAVATVAPSLMSLSTYTFVPARGAYPIGGLTMPESATSLDDYHTSNIIEENGHDKVLQAYLQIQPGDVLVACMNADTDHAVMAIDVPHVEYAADGSIDLEKSYVRIQDQRAKEMFEEVDGYTRSIRGRLDYHMPFKEMFDSAFVPFAPKEFLDNAIYEPAVVRLNKDVTTLDELAKATVLSTYRITAVHTRAYNGAGGLVYDNADILEGYRGGDAQKQGYKVSGVLSKQNLKNALQKGKTYTVVIEVRIATGELFKLGQVSYTVE